ncbi:LysR family transcriptional regulator [Pseudomonas sp. DSP3-2-2]|uniref:LysR family transcriptional regulator n=1 Tax=unclassified Pseudomonas TaxID=196821 RepID=UPI003CF5684C
MACTMSRSRTIDLALIRTFVAVAQTGSISAAARQLHLTQGGISQQVKRLELFFDCLLLDRDPQGTQLTDRGADFLPKARRLLELNDSVCEEMIGRDIRETVRVGVPYDMAGAHFAPILKAFAHRHQNVEVTILTGSSVDLRQDFSRGLVDLTISQCPESEAVGERLSLEPLIWIGTADDLFRRRPLPVCFVTPTCTFRRTVFSLLGQAHISWRVVFENASVEATLATVRSGLALTPWLRSLVPGDLRELGVDSGLPLLPDFAIELHVSQSACDGALNMAEVIRQHYCQEKSIVSAGLKGR